MKAQLPSAIVILVSAFGSALTGQGFQSESVRGRFVFDVGPTVNRVEGIPVSIGALIETIQDDPLRIDARAIIRIADNLPAELDRAGFRAFIEKTFANRRFAVGASGWSEVISIEDRGLSDLESSLAAFVFHDDRRDYVDGVGLAVYGRYSPPRSPIRLALQYRFEDHDPINPGGGSSIFFNDDPWRFQPLSARGQIHSIVGVAQYDTRPTRPDGPFNGWFVTAQVYKAVGGDLVNLTAVDEMAMPVADLPEPDDRLATGMVDVRRYNAIGDLGINLRVQAGGSLTNRSLPPQFQHAPGGVGTVPGYPLFEFDCGARTPNSSVIPLEPALATNFFRYYGCDRFVLAQVEVVGYFGFRLAAGEDRSVWEGPANFTVDLSPRWMVFANAVQAWTNLDASVTFAVDEDVAYDVGGGVLFGDIGFLAAYPLTGNDKTVRGVVRLERRF